MQTLHQLRDFYGQDIVLLDDDEESIIYRIVEEFAMGGHEYAVLQTDEMKRDEEVDIFRIGRDSEGNFELETIDDDEEWELAAETYDEMLFPPEQLQ